MNNTPPRIGMSLTPAYLSGQPDEPDRQWYGPPEAFLQELADAGITHIELRAIRPNTDPAVARAALEQVWSADLEATIHGTLPLDSSGEDWIDSVRPLIDLLRLRHEHNPAEPCAVALHAYADRDPDADLAPLADRSVAMLQRFGRWLERKGLNTTLSLEINRAKGAADPSVTYAGVLAMQQRVGLPNVGICWDMGHTWSNIRQGVLEQAPPPGFVAAVRHTHIHDLGSTGVTHWPLTEQRLPLAWFADQLNAAGYGGVWNIELEPVRYRDEPDIRPRVLRSVARLANVVRHSAISAHTAPAANHE